jgi:predicted DNA binding CopG/RHH family protein
MEQKKILAESLTIRISEELLENYKKYCDENGLSYSKRIRFFMKKDIEGKIEIRK